MMKFEIVEQSTKCAVEVERVEVGDAEHRKQKEE
jgi:hypothetical protein